MDKYEVPYPFVVNRKGYVVNSRTGLSIKALEDNEGCLVVDLLYSKKNRQYVHRLVAEKFLDNPNNYENVLFKDGNVKNCNADNLEWCP